MTKTAADLSAPLHAAETLTEVTAATVAAVELKLADVEPAGTTTLPGTSKDGDEEVSITFAFACAAPLRATAQLMLPPDVIDEGLQVMPANAGAPEEPGEIETTEILDMPLHAAETLTEVTAATVAAVDLKLTEVDPAGTTTLPGTGNEGEEEVRMTVALARVAVVKLTRQLVLAQNSGLRECR